jgi:hypothetical protein
LEKIILKLAIAVLVFGMVPGVYSSSLVSDTDTIQVTLLHGRSSVSDIIISIDSPMSETSYTGYIDYIDEFSKPIIGSYSFDDSLEWNSSGNLQWILRSDPVETLNGTRYVCVSSRTDGFPLTLNSYLTSGILDFSSIPEPAIEFEQIKTDSRSHVTVQISKDSSAWTDIYSSSLVIGDWSSPEIKKINIPREFAVPGVYLRFAADLPLNSGSWALDNIKIKGSNWLNLNDSITAYGTVKNWMYEIINDTVRVNIGSSNLAPGLYQALIRFESSLNNHDVPVNLTVIDQLSVPEVLINSDTDQVVLSWSAVPGATSYKVYSCEEPYGTFGDVSSEGTFTGTTWTKTGVAGNKLFYYVVSVSE